ncbi:hypothetical protein HYT04_01395 [Candidatus Kaiserbacteria bacterium]|nr:hypothetical protein [Candidatus Kaiserbacteria bacterium]
MFFGILGSEGQFDLSRMLEEEFSLKKCSQLLLSFEGKRDSALVTQTVEQESETSWKTITFTFSPAH